LCNRDLYGLEIVDKKVKIVIAKTGGTVIIFIITNVTR
jgi:hypothetical protein